jgi:hypothetical protein
MVRLRPPLFLLLPPDVVNVSERRYMK